MLRAPDGQPVDGVVVDHLRDGAERLAELAQDDPAGPGRVALDAHVHEAVRRSGRGGGGKLGRSKAGEDIVRTTVT